MKFAFGFLALVIAQALATPSAPLISSSDQIENIDNIRAKKAAYGGGASYGGGSSYAAPPCPSNYLVSCAPNLQPVGCSQASYGSAGAYSALQPQYIVPQFYKRY